MTITDPAEIITPVLHDDVAELRARCRGPVLAPDSPGYDEARAVWNLAVQQHPAVVVLARDVADIVQAVRCAAAHRLPVAVRATGHGTARAADGAVLVVTSALTELTIDPVARTARLGAGIKWGPVLAAAQTYGLAPLLGSSPDVGAVGYLLGGGMGWLGRHYGLAADTLRAVELVTPDGRELRATMFQHRDLFWALQGAGPGTLGVVTAIEIDLVPVTMVYGGNLVYPASDAGDVLRRWREWIGTVSEELTSAVCLINLPPTDDVPEPLRGGSFVIVRGCWSGGDLDQGRAVVDQWREWRTPLVDLFGPMPFSEVATISADPIDPMPFKLSTEWFDSLPDGAVDALVSHTYLNGGPPLLAFAELRHAGGAIARGRRGALDRGRSGTMLLTLLGVPQGPESGAAVDAHFAATRSALAPYVTGAAYLNFTGLGEKQERTSAAFGAANRRRLAEIKAAVDPTGMFSHGLDLLDE